MATIHRLDYLGAIHHVYVRGNEKRAIFTNDEDRSFLLGRLKKLKQETEFRIYAFCLMTNHLHLLIETGKQALDAVMGRLLSVYAARYRREHGGVGYLFQGRYGAKLCARDAYFLRLVRYIHRNPVQAGMCAEPIQYPWSGHAQLAAGLDGIIDEDLPLSFFGNGDAARAAYAAFCSEAADDNERMFIPETPRLAPGLELGSLATAVSTEFAIPIEQLLAGTRKRDHTAAKLELLERAQINGHSMKAVADLLRLSPSALCQLRQRNKLIS